MADKFVTPHPLPTPAQCEALLVLIEECAEVAQRATKAMRFGMREVQPGQELRNDERLSHEFGDLLTVAALCRDLGLINRIDILTGAHQKLEQLARFLQNSDLELSLHRVQARFERGDYL